VAKGSKEIRRRIRSVKNTQQITKAMKMVAAARLRKSEGRSVASRPYTDTLRDVMRQLSAAGTESDHPFLTHLAPDVKRVLLVLYTGDKGLAGSFNANLIKRAEQFIREQQALGNEVELLCVGKKGWQYFVRRLGQPATYRPSFTDKSGFADLRPLIDEITNAYMSHSVSEVYLIYARFVNVVKNIPSVVRLLPIEAPQSTPEQGGFRAEYELEPSPQELLEVLVPRYFQTILFQAALENFTSENGARMVAMENATKAAGDMIQDLTLQYNKARQAGITLELLDIVGGAEALKG
jgi:F-type H+-transporting ATPase subunit gamma